MKINTCVSLGCLTLGEGVLTGSPAGGGGSRVLVGVTGSREGPGCGPVDCGSDWSTPSSSSSLGSSLGKTASPDPSPSVH